MKTFCSMRQQLQIFVSSERKLSNQIREDSQKKIYGRLVDYKERHITRDCGKYKGEEHPGFLPEKFWTQELPAMLYDGIPNRRVRIVMWQ